LRSWDHIEAILAGLRDGTIDAIASDHAPHHADEKALEYDQARLESPGWKLQLA